MQKGDFPKSTRNPLTIGEFSFITEAYKMGFCGLFPALAQPSGAGGYGIWRFLLMKNSDSKKNQKYILAGIAAALVVLALAVVFWPRNVRKELTIEAGTHALEASAFLKEDKGDPVVFVSDISAIDLNTPGEHTLTLRYNDKEQEVKLIIEDTISPEAEVRNLSAYSHQEPRPEDFIVSVHDATAVTVTFEKKEDWTKEGSYLVNLLLTDLGGNTARYEAVLTVFVDTGAPQLAGVAELYTYLGTKPDYLANVTAMDDMTRDLTILVDDSQVQLDTLGTYPVTYSVTDEAGYTDTAETTVTVTDDNTAPTILGVKDISLYLGSAVSYRKGIQVRDDQDTAPTLEIQSADVDLSNPGTYPLTYIARDLTGNETRVEVTVTVAAKPDTFVEEEVIFEKADALLKKIVSDNMTDEAKVKAIYAYMRSNFGYSGHSDKTDWMQGAYVMMDEGAGDCFNYFALTKLLLERLGIPNLDVVKVKNYEGDSAHYWSLVSVDGGATYYHLDTTPRVGDGDDFCLVTDAFLDAYSDANKKCHNRDKSLYPATPAA